MNQTMTNQHNPPPGPGPEPIGPDVLHVDFCGIVETVDPGQGRASYTFGRAGDLAVDEDNRYLHRHLGQFRWDGHRWWVDNIGTSIAINLFNSTTSSQAVLTPGSSLPVGHGTFSVAFTAGPHHYQVEGFTSERGFERWCQEVRGIAQRLDQNGGYDPATDPTNNYLHLVPTINGITYVSGQLVGELALTIKKLIDGETDRVLTRYRSDAEASGGEVPVPSRAQACAEALGEMLDRGSGVPDGSGKLPEPEIVVILNDQSGELTDDDGNHLSPEILRFIIAAGLIRPLEVAGSGDPLRMGRTLRYANRHQRRALMTRDGGCIFPGCDRPASWCDAHHVDEWDDNGPTDINNLGLLCRHHHRVTHRPGWTMTRTAQPPTTQPNDPNTADPDQVRFRWRTPTGRLIDSQRHHQRSHPTAA